MRHTTVFVAAFALVVSCSYPARAQSGGRWYYNNSCAPVQQSTASRTAPKAAIAPPRAPVVTRAPVPRANSYRSDGAPAQPSMRVEYEALRPVQPRVAPIRPAINHQHFIVPQDHYRDGDGHFAT